MPNASSARTRRLAAELIEDLARDHKPGTPLSRERFFDELRSRFSNFIKEYCQTDIRERDTATEELLGKYLSSDICARFRAQIKADIRDRQNGRPRANEDQPFGFIPNSRLFTFPEALEELVEILTKIAGGQTDNSSPQYVKAQQIAGYLQVSKKHVERWIARLDNPFPQPAIEGGGGKAAEWIWLEIVPWLRAETNHIISDRFPSSFRPT